MKNEFLCIPLHTLCGELIAIDLCYRPQNKPGHGNPLAPQPFMPAQVRLLNQLLIVEHHADIFLQHGLLCSLAIDFQQAQAVIESSLIQQMLSHLPFVRLRLSEQFPNLHDGMNNPLLRTLVERLNVLWLNDLGAGHANLHALQSNMFEAIKLDRQFYQINVRKPWFNILIDRIRQYSSRIIIEGMIDNAQLQVLRDSHIWAVQGYFMPMLTLDNLLRHLVTRGKVN
ncbi:EAL domain-containing protein [Erwinia piriflorinigrans]|uniref:EAL domain-containing protein n=1 Tax=Erwinia piriflorinigrans CFBP 5888 TaxID=1161919 RepID=V5Z6Z8_9GAMM|nr:EAL domain-containing protein [Erwinia piriflorinigrans]CCG87102.1 putative protein yhjH [Erwinia piriflorinigrans CFBP 5888]